MAKLSAVQCKNPKPSNPEHNPTLEYRLGEGDGLFLRVMPNGSKTWLIEYQFKARTRRYTIGQYSEKGASAKSNTTDLLRHAQLALAQSRMVAAEWRATRLGGHDPIEEWEALLSSKKAEQEAAAAVVEAERNQPTVAEAVESFMVKVMAGKKSAPAIQYRLERLTAFIGDKKIRDVLINAMRMLFQSGDSGPAIVLGRASWEKYFALAPGGRFRLKNLPPASMLRSRSFPETHDDGCCIAGVAGTATFHSTGSALAGIAPDG